MESFSNLVQRLAKEMKAREILRITYDPNVKEPEIEVWVLSGDTPPKRICLKIQPED